MAQAHQTTPKHRLQLNALLLVLVGLFSAASPLSFQAAHLHHRSPASASRTSRHLGRPRANGSSRTSSDAEIEPEIAAATSGTTVAPPAPRADLAASIPATRTFAVSPVCVACLAQEDPTLALSAPPLPHLGRAPPVAA